MIDFVKCFSSVEIDVNWDDEVKPSLRNRYNNLNQARISIKIFDILFGLGSVQPKRLKSSWIYSLIDNENLIEKLVDSQELKLRINDIKNSLDSERLGKISEELGIGLSVAVISKLYDVQKSTITRIRGINVQRPDWRCLLNDNRVLQVEAKGSTSKDTRAKQLREAVGQKLALPADVHIAVASLLKEASISEMKIKDPPSNDNFQIDNNYRHVDRAYHYSSVFSFIGESVLSLYFEKMARRLSGEIGSDEMDDKELMFNFLNNDAPCVKIDEGEYVGHLYGPIDNQYMFLGVNKELLYYRGFMEFQDADEDKIIMKDGIQFMIYTDGILVARVGDYDSFYRVYHIASTGVSMDTVALNDLDSIRTNSFNRYVKYILDKCDANPKWESRGTLKAKINENERIYHILHIRYNKGERFPDRTLKRIKDFMKERQGVLVTNLRIPQEELDFPCIGRTDFERIASSHADINVVREVFGMR